MVIVIQCKDQVGLVAAITTVLMEKNINIISMREFVNTEDNRFFVRIQTAGNEAAHVMEEELKAVLPNDAAIKVNPLPEKKIVVLVTKEYHCLSDLLLRNKFDEGNFNIMAVISNYEYLQELTSKFDIPYFYISHTEKSREAHDQEILSLLHQLNPDFIVLAKYMRILSPAFVQSYNNRIINIHHSFLPAFAGANPYQKAYERGVKIIGATAHFVNELLDEGPIIAQNVIPVNHTLDAKEMASAGRGIERNVLANALELVCNEKVFVFKNKTIVFA